MKPSFVESWSQQVQRLRNRGFLDAAMAAAALVATADDEVRLSEQLAVDQLLERMDRLKLYDPRAGAEIHRKYAARIESDPEKGRKAAYDSVARFRDREEERSLLLYVAASVARADNDLSAVEQETLDRIAETLGLQAAESIAAIWEGAPAR